MGGYKVLKRIGEMSDGWISSYYSPNDFRDAWLEILGYAKAAGREEKEMLNVDILPISIKGDFDSAREEVPQIYCRITWICLPGAKPAWKAPSEGQSKIVWDQTQENEQAGLQTVELLPCYYDAELVTKIGNEIIPLLKKMKSKKVIDDSQKITFKG